MVTHSVPGGLSVVEGLSASRGSVFDSTVFGFIYLESGYDLLNETVYGE